MPTESVVVVAAITLAFVVFALVLAWADNYTKKTGAPGSKDADPRYQP